MALTTWLINFICLSVRFSFDIVVIIDPVATVSSLIFLLRTYESPLSMLRRVNNRLPCPQLTIDALLHLAALSLSVHPRGLLKLEPSQLLGLDSYIRCTDVKDMVISVHSINRVSPESVVLGLSHRRWQNLELRSDL